MISINVYAPEDMEKVLTLDINKVEKRELKASTGLNPKEALRASIEISIHCWYAVEDGVIVGVGGIAPHPEEECMGVPWMLSNETLVRKHLFTINALTFDLLDFSFNTLGFDVLCNYVDLRNTSSIKWLKSVGFEFMDKCVALKDPKVGFDEFYMYKEDFNV